MKEDHIVVQSLNMHTTTKLYGSELIQLNNNPVIKMFIQIGKHKAESRNIEFVKVFRLTNDEARICIKKRDEECVIKLILERYDKALISIELNVSNPGIIVQQ